MMTPWLSLLDFALLVKWDTMTFCVGHAQVNTQHIIDLQSFKGMLSV
jgi:hypothetical protein